MIDTKLRAAVIKRDSSTCQDCGHAGQTGHRKGDIQVHHIEPGRLGGSDTMNNLVALCVECHGKRDTSLRRTNPSLDGNGRPILYQSAMTEVIQVPMSKDMRTNIQNIINSLDYPLTLAAAMRLAAQDWIKARERKS